MWLRPAVKDSGEKYYEYVQSYADVYLGADVKKFAVETDSYTWGILPDMYDKSDVNEVERKLSEIGVSTAMTSGYQSTPKLKPEQASNYQSLIGVLQWAVKLGRVDISLLCCSSHGTFGCSVTYFCILETLQFMFNGFQLDGTCYQ